MRTKTPTKRILLLALLLGLAPWAVLVGTYGEGMTWFYATIGGANLGLVLILYCLLLPHRRAPLFPNPWIFVPVYPASGGSLLLLMHITWWREDSFALVFGLVGSVLGNVAMLALLQYVCIRLRRHSREPEEVPG